MSAHGDGVEQATGTLIRLRRPLLARLFGSVPQLILALFAATFVLVTVLAVRSGDWSQWPWSSVQLLAVLVWLRMATGWARADRDGVHWRLLVGSSHSWAAVRSVKLTRRALFATYRASGTPVVVISIKGGEDYVAPALRCGRHRRAFATDLLAEARARGIRTEVVSTGWNEAPTHLEEPWD